MAKSEICGERNCGRAATHIVNEVAYVCSYQAEGANLEGWIVEEIESLNP